MKIIHKQCESNPDEIDTYIDDGTLRLIRCENRKVDYSAELDKGGNKS